MYLYSFNNVQCKLLSSQIGSHFLPSISYSRWSTKWNTRDHVDASHILQICWTVITSRSCWLIFLKFCSFLIVSFTREECFYFAISFCTQVIGRNSYKYIKRTLIEGHPYLFSIISNKRALVLHEVFCNSWRLINA